MSDYFLKFLRILLDNKIKYIVRSSINIHNGILIKFNGLFKISFHTNPRWHVARVNEKHAGNPKTSLIARGSTQTECKTEGVSAHTRCVLWRRSSCHAMPCHAMPYHTMPCHHHTKPCVTPCYTMSVTQMSYTCRRDFAVYSRHIQPSFPCSLHIIRNFHSAKR